MNKRKGKNGRTCSLCKRNTVRKSNAKEPLCDRCKIDPKWFLPKKEVPVEEIPVEIDPEALEENLEDVDPDVELPEGLDAGDDIGLTILKEDE